MVPSRSTPFAQFSLLQRKVYEAQSDDDVGTLQHRGLAGTAGPRCRPRPMFGGVNTPQGVDCEEEAQFEAEHFAGGRVGGVRAIGVVAEETGDQPVTSRGVEDGGRRDGEGEDVEEVVGRVG